VLRGDSRGTPVIGRVRPERKTLQDFVSRGGRLAVFHQNAYPEGLFDVQLTDHGSTMTFGSRLGRIRAFLEDDDLRFWRGDHLVATRELLRPSVGGFRADVLSGSAAGIDHAPVVTQSIGRGFIVFSQLLSVEKYAGEPAAQWSLIAVIESLLYDRPLARKTALVGGDSAYRQYLRGLGMRFDDLTGRLATADLRQYGLLICRGN